MLSGNIFKKQFITICYFVTYCQQNAYLAYRKAIINEQEYREGTD